MSDATPAPIPTAASSRGHPAPARGQATSWALWFGLFGAPAAWSLQLLVNTALASHGCYPRLYPLSTPGTGGLRGITFGVGVAALAVCIAAAAVAWRSWLATRGEHQQSSGEAREHAAGHALLETGEGRTRFMALSGVMMSATFLVASLAHTASVLMVGPCGR